ncbi:MAG TPA: hypothetical protein VMH26_04310 [Burkholderiales bacterium]|nr:hypothetical protein [Burkholderiales bacterium]
MNRGRIFGALTLSRCCTILYRDHPFDEEPIVPVFRLPLSGNVTQSINPWTWLFSPVGSQVGLINIELGQSTQPQVEEDVLTDVASYGKQLGRIEDALLVLLDHFAPARPLSDHENRAIADLRDLVTSIAAIKDRHRRPG